MPLEASSKPHIILSNVVFPQPEGPQKEFTQYFPKDGWVEHDAIEIWNGVKNLLKTDKYIFKVSLFRCRSNVTIAPTNQLIALETLC